MNTQRTKEVVVRNKTGTLSGRLSSAVIAFLVLLVQVLLPIAPVFADEGAPAPQSTDAVTEPAATVETVTKDDSHSDESRISVPLTETDDVTPEKVTPQAGVEILLDATTELPIGDFVEESTADVGLSEASTTTDEIVIEDSIGTLYDVASTTIEVVPEVADPEIPLREEELPLPEVIEEETEVIEDPIDNATDTIDELNDEIEASTTAEQTVVPPEVHIVTNDANRFSFGVEDCAQVADGSFYCRNKEEMITPITTDRVFAGPDIEGDSEIYIERNGEVTQITHNLVDDGAPYYDADSDTLVWHRLVEARYQIVSYDLETREETVLTNDHYNNMQPSRAGDITVWQGWIGNDWEILSMVDDEITMLTDNTLHDIGPRINGDYVIWQAEEADGWKVRVYDRLTKQTETIADADGASIENPRFVLLYDAKQENGDIETRGYDLESGKSVPLSAQPHSIPDEIPDPDQTGEDRALIVNTTQLKTKTEDDSEPDTDTLDQTAPVGSGTTTEDVVIPPFGSADSIEESAPVDPTTTSRDLVIEPLRDEAPAVEIPDLIVLPYALPHVEEVDPQDEVATTS